MGRFKKYAAILVFLLTGCFAHDQKFTASVNRNKMAVGEAIELTFELANANGKNDIAIIVPCHRVIGSGGELVGYAGGLWRKKWLLDHEAKYFSGVQTFDF